jgi:hypothetical protein
MSVNNIVMAAAGASTDNYLTNPLKNDQVSCLLLGEEATLPSSFTDTTSKTTLNTYGSVATSATRYRSGSKSLSFPGGSAWLSPQTASSFTFPGNFSILFWVYPTAGNKILIDFRGNRVEQSTNISLFLSSSFTLALYLAGAHRIISASTTPINTWSHVAIIRNSGVITMYINGVSQGTYATTASLAPADSTRPLIGGNGYYTTQFGDSFTGYLDEFVVLPSTALYSANFTPPSL